MAIPCPGCGREYDVTLFQFGRTIRCTCGRRVGMEKRLGPEGEGGEKPRFLADAMLRGLARRLRLLGYDAAWEPGGDDGALVRRALEEGRTLLTRDREIPREWRISNLILVDEDDPWAQLEAVVRRLDLKWRAGLFTRCSRCNVGLEEMSGDEKAARPLPPSVRGRSVRRCPSCGRRYWEGDHTRRIRRRLEGRLAE